MTHDRAQQRRTQSAFGEADEELPASIVPGSRFGRYDIVRCIGVGGMGAVFEVTHSLLKKRMAMKAMHGNLSRSEPARERFLREAETVARIRHANVVDITDVGLEGCVPYFVMEFLEGEDLASLLERGKLDATAAVDVAVPVLAGLCAVHGLGIVHRDIKPENIFLARDHNGMLLPKLVDFGVSKDIAASFGAGVPPLHTVTGTPHYMSPEQARGAATLDARTDQYAVGVLLYQALSGRRPYEAESLLELMHVIDQGVCKPLHEVRPELPAELSAIVTRAMARNARDRFETTDAFGRALLPFASERARFAYQRDFEQVVKAPSFASLSGRPELGARLAAGTVPSDPVGGPLLGTIPRHTSSGVRERNRAQETLAEDAGVTVSAEEIVARTRKSRPSVALWLLLGAALAVGFLLVFALWMRSAPAPQEGPGVAKSRKTPVLMVPSHVPAKMPKPAAEAQGTPSKLGLPSESAAPEQAREDVADSAPDHHRPRKRGSSPSKSESEPARPAAPSTTDIQLSR